MTAEHLDSWPKLLDRWAGLIDAEQDNETASCNTKPHIVIGVCTRQRNVLLRRLIDSIWAQPIPSSHSVELLVVDNNDHPAASEAFVGLPIRFPVTVVHEPRIGLVHARNRALNEATARKADWFIGVDDDEWVAADWLANFTAGLEEMASPILIAPCRYVYGAGLSRFLKPWQLPSKPRGTRPVVLATSNYAMHRCVFDGAHGPGLRFDPIFNESGAEDLEFFLRAERTFGWVPAWWPDAVAFENWDGVRATLRYRLSRSLRNQVSTYQVAQQHRLLGYHGSRMGNLMRVLLQMNRHAVYGAGGLAAGLALLPFQPRKGCHLIGEGLERSARALAVLPFALGASPVAYGQNAGLQS